jgi:hypothetical protein
MQTHLKNQLTSIMAPHRNKIDTKNRFLSNTSHNNCLELLMSISFYQLQINIKIIIQFFSSSNHTDILFLQIKMTIRVHQKFILYGREFCFILHSVLNGLICGFDESL